MKTSLTNSYPDQSASIQPGWKLSHSIISIYYICILIVGILIAYNVRAVEPIWFIVIFIIGSWYFLTLYYCSKHWLKLSDRAFRNNLFYYSLLFRVTASIVLVIVAEATWDMPHYVGAIDARSYYNEAVIVADLFRNFDIQGAYSTAISFTGKIDNAGPPLLFGFLFAIFGKHYFVGSFAYALFGSYAVVLLYKIARLVWDEDISRTAAIMYMPFPLALFFSVVYLKEGFVVFLLLSVVYLVTKAINGNALSISNFSSLIIAMTALFFFRTVVGALLAVLVPGAFLINRYRGSRIKSILIVFITIIVFGVLIYAMGEHQFFLDRLYSAERVGESRAASLGLGQFEFFGTTVMNTLLTPLYLIISFVTPFPGMVDVGTRFDTGHDSNYYFMIGEITWNILAYFSLVGFFYSIKERLFKGVMVWAFTGGYLYAMVVTVLFTRVRFAYVVMPIMLILAAVGVYKTKNKLYWLLYLTGILVATIIWNYLRIEVRAF